jgi:hypothetical protein
MPGITIVPEEGATPNEMDAHLEELRSAIVEIDTKITAASGE